MNDSLRPVGIVHSCFSEKFGIPRQPGLAPAATAILELLPPWNTADAVRGLEAWSHLWLIFQFHQHRERKPTPTARPPRLGGNTRCGVFACRSSFRPNHLGLSVVKLQRLAHEGRRLHLHLAGVDLLDGTPVFDIKPYVPYSDAIADARAPWSTPVEPLSVMFLPAAEAQCQQAARQHPDIRELIVQLLQQDPRPAYHHNATRPYHMRLWQWDITFRVNHHTAQVEALQRIP